MDQLQGARPGWIEVITGSMFSGKSEELIRRLRRAQIARQQVQIFKPVIDDRYIRAAFKAEGLNYDAQLKNGAKSPLKARDALTGKAIADFRRVAGIWVNGEPKVRHYGSITSALKDLNRIERSGKSVRAVYVHDLIYQIKLLGNLAWYATDANGQVTFTTIFPACYDGRWPHMHFEVFSSVANATGGRLAILTSQLAMPAAIASAVFNGASGYSSSVSNFARVSLNSDMVFADNSAAQIAAMTPAFSGSVAAGYTATATIGIAR